MSRLLTTALLLRSVVSGQTNTCPDLSQSDAPFYDLEQVLDTPLFLPLSIVAPLIPAPVSQCLASFEGSTISNVIAAIDASCLSVQPTFDNLAEIKDLVELLAQSTGNTNNRLASVFEFIYNAKDASYVNLCKPIRTPLTPCIRNSLPRILAFLTNNRPCCADFRPYVQRTLGTSLETGLANLYTNLVNAVCSYRSPGFDTKQTPFQTCGYTFFHSLIDSMNVNEGLNVLKLFEIPNGEACKAYTGEAFVSTAGFAKSPINPNPKKSLDSCSVYLDTLVKRFASIPALSDITLGPESTPLSDVVTQDKCLSWSLVVDSVIELVLNTVPGYLKPVLDGLLTDQAQTIEFLKSALRCIHLPMGFSDQCAFTSDATTFLSTNDLTDNQEPNDSEVGNKGSSSDSGVSRSRPVIIWMMMVVLSTVMMMFE